MRKSLDYLVNYILGRTEKHTCLVTIETGGKNLRHLLCVTQVLQLRQEMEGRYRAINGGILLMGGAVFPPYCLTSSQTMVELMKIMATSFKGSQARSAELSALTLQQATANP